MGFFSKLFGNDAEETELYVYITGMVCQNCAEHVEKALKAIQGVHKVSVNLGKGIARVWADDTVDRDVLFKAVVNAGYTVTDITDHQK